MTTLTADPKRRAWLKERQTGIGSSDVAKILGLSEWGSPLEVYLDKVGLLPEQPMTAEQEAGLRHEPTLARWYEDLTGLSLYQPEMMRHPTRKWLLASCDRIARDHGCGRIVELKTAHSPKGWGRPGTAEVPPHYGAQVQQQMFVSGIDVADFAVLIGLADFRVYTVHHDPDFYHQALSVLAEFWAHVQREVPPAPDWGHSLTPKLMDRLYRPVDETPIVLGDDVAKLAVHYEVLARQIREAEKRKSLLRGQLAQAMGSATQAVLPGGLSVTRKVVHKREHVRKASEEVRLTVKGVPGQEEADDVELSAA